MATVEDVRWLGSSLERSYEVFVRGRLKFRVGSIVYVAFSLDETEMGFGFPKEERAALVASAPDTFRLPRESEMRFNWVESSLAALDPVEACELVVDAWRLCVPKKVSAAYDLRHPGGPGPDRPRVRLEAEHRQTLARLADLSQDFDAVVAASRDTNADDEHDPEGATIAFERSQVQALVRQAREHLAEIEAAMERVDAGTFGTCEDCGQPIGAGRLDARPVARTCISCAGKPRGRRS